MAYIYLASPYTHEDPKEMEWRYNRVVEWIGDRLRLYSKPVIYSPIVHFHPVTQMHEFPPGVDFWWEQNKAMIDSASALWVLQLPLWKASKGVAKEIEYARMQKMKVKYVR